MSSFFNLYESQQKDAGKDFWFSPASNEDSSEIIKRGLEIRSDRTDGNTFWDDFINILGQNTEEASKLLGVPRDKIAKWPGKIKKLLGTVRKDNESSETKNKKSHMLTTGNS